MVKSYGAVLSFCPGSSNRLWQVPELWRGVGPAHTFRYLRCCVCGRPVPLPLPYQGCEWWPGVARSQGAFDGMMTPAELAMAKAIAGSKATSRAATRDYEAV